MDEGSSVKSQKLVKPVLQTLARDVEKYYCEVSLGSCVKRNKKRMGMRKVDNDKLKSFASEWKQLDHPYNQVIARADWSILADTVESIIIDQASTSSKIPERTIRTSTRKNMVYPDAVANKKCCIICNKKKKQKGRMVPLTLITLRENDTKKHKAEETLLMFANIHVKHHTKFKEAAESRLLVSSTKSLFAADACYHREECYMPFRGSCWLKLESETCQEQSHLDVGTADPLGELKDLINVFVIQK